MASGAPAGVEVADDDGVLPVPAVALLLGVDSEVALALELGERLAVGLLVDVQVKAQTRTAVSRARACAARFIFWWCRV